MARKIPVTYSLSAEALKEGLSAGGRWEKTLNYFFTTYKVILLNSKSVLILIIHMWQPCVEIEHFPGSYSKHKNSTFYLLPSSHYALSRHLNSIKWFCHEILDFRTSFSPYYTIPFLRTLSPFLSIVSEIYFTRRQVQSCLRLVHISTWVHHVNKLTIDHTRMQ